MKRTLLFTAALLLLSSFAAAEEWTKTYTVTGKPELTVDTSDADIRVDTWNQNTIEARVVTTGYKIGEGGIQIVEHQSGNAVDMQVKFPHHFGITIGTHSHRVEIIVRMPQQGQVDLRTGDGSIRLQGLKGNMDLKSGDGAVEIEQVDGHLRAHTSDGHIRAQGRFDELDLSTGDGRVEATVLSGSAVSQNWTVHTGDGAVHLQLPSDLAADVDLQTGDGHISVGIPVTVQGQMGGNHVRGKLNNGGNLVTVHTGDGSIDVEKTSGSV
jgi:DUF4097 and DUF4098 domain-containing protein YvlB